MMFKQSYDSRKNNENCLSILFFVALLCAIVSHGNAYEFHWEIDETPEGQESATIVEPVQVMILDDQVEISSHSAAIQLMKKYSVHLTGEWSPGHAYRLFYTFESIPQEQNLTYFISDNQISPSVWTISNHHIHNDIEIEYRGEVRIVNISADAFNYATPLVAEIEGIRGRYFSKRLHHAVVSFVTDNGSDRGAIERILQGRFGVSTQHINYVELTKHTTGEHAGRFSEFKNDELIAIISMFEELPSGMHITPGLKYLMRRLDGITNPRYPDAPAVAWRDAGYIEFMEGAFSGGNLDYIHRLILHEKAHFLWDFLFDDQLKQDWIELGGWYKNPDDVDGWSTTKQTEFVSTYAHEKNPNEDMAESISFYIVRPDKLRSRSPAKYEFIQNRIMHGTRYISQIREDLTFEVYNLYPDYVYPGKIIRIDIQVEGEPEEDKHITIEIELHKESDLDSAHGAHLWLQSNKTTSTFVGFHAVDESGNRLSNGHILRCDPVKISKYAADGYWMPGTIWVEDANRNVRNNGVADFGWKLYIDNPLADCKPPAYVPNTAKLSLSHGDEDGRTYQIINVSWKYIENSYMSAVDAFVNDKYRETYSRGNLGSFDDNTGTASVDIAIPNYMPGGTYQLVRIQMTDIAGNQLGTFFTYPEYAIHDDGINDILLKDELPPTIDIQTKNPDFNPPVLDLNDITVRAEPTRPENPNGETNVYVSFKVKDDISGYREIMIGLTDPQGVGHSFWYSHKDAHNLYFQGDPTVFQTYNETIFLPAGSIPGKWGINQMIVVDKASNKLNVDFTEIVRFEVTDGSIYAKYDVNEDGVINILDLVIVAAFDVSNERADVNGDGTINILDLVVVASHLGEEDIAAPAAHSPTAEQIQSWITQAMQADEVVDENPAFRRGIRALQNLLLKLRPETTVLLPNYPNPFNPETWIPYQLAGPASVTVSIYSTDGQLTRTLELGHQTAGLYQDRNRAAYWDGKNESGETAASGIYFYKLKAGDYSATRKMLILK